MTVPADEQRLRAIKEMATTRKGDGRSYSKNELAYGLRDLLALLRLREQEADEAKTPHWAGAERLAETMAGWSPGSSHANHDAAMETLRAERDAALAEAAELREALLDLLDNGGFGHGHWRDGGSGGTCATCETQQQACTRARAALEATDDR